jgi:ParB-like chromosome segregation protein Spo0J
VGVTVTGSPADHTLIAGERRLAACTSLGWETIPARVVDLDDPLGAEIDENRERKDFLPSEKVALSYAIRAREEAKAQARLQASGKKYGRGKIGSGNLPDPIEDQGQVRDKTAKDLGWSAHTLERATFVVEAARKDPEDEDLQAILEEMACASERIHGASARGDPPACAGPLRRRGVEWNIV